MVKSKKEKEIDVDVESCQTNEVTNKPEVVKEKGKATISTPKKAPVQRAKSVYMQYIGSEDCKKAYEKYKKNFSK